MVNRIRELRQERAATFPAAFTATAVARRLGVTDKTLRSWEQGIRRPTARHARALARDLGVKLEELRLGAEAADQTAAREEAEAGRASVALAVIVHEGRALMTRRRWNEGPFQWNFVSGEIEDGETPEQAAVREVREEVGLDVEVVTRVGERVQPVSGRHMVYLVCRVVSEASLAELVDHEENVEVCWCDLDEMHERLASLAAVPGGLYPPLFEYLDRVLKPARPA